VRRALSLIRSLLGVVFLALLLSPIVGPPLWVELGGRTAAGTIEAKREAIVELSGTWMRRLFVAVRYVPSDTEEPAVSEVAVDAATYDRLRVGQPARVRYVPNATLRQIGNLPVARLDSQLPLGSFVAWLGDFAIVLLAGVAAWLALLWVWSKWRRGWLALLLFLLMFGGMLYIGSGWPPPQPDGALVAGSAAVRAAHQVTRVWESRRSPGEEATQPYTIVELSFVPQGAGDAVVAVDMVDAGSVPALEKGVDVPIHYSARDPRWAQIDGAARTYYWKNLRGFGLIGLVLLGLVLLGWLAGRRRRARRARVAP
jgi:hypothetical protein